MLQTQPDLYKFYQYETVRYAGSGIVFNNTYDPDVTPEYRSAVIQAENILQRSFSDHITFNVEFTESAAKNADGTPDNTFVAVNQGYNAALVSYDQLKSALVAHATTADDFAAVNSLPASDPSHGAHWVVPYGMAEILGLANFTPGPLDQTITLNSNYIFNWNESPNTWTFKMDAVGVLVHELTEGLFGRISELGLRGGDWAPMDLFRYNSGLTPLRFGHYTGPLHDYSGGADGQATYFSVTVTPF
jgi:hypothetical protein